MNYENQARIFKALCDEKRLKILELLQEGDQCACVLVEKLDIPQSSLSYHMKILVDSTIVEYRKEGKWTYYTLCNEGMTLVKDLIDTIMFRPENNNTACSCQKERQMDSAH